MKPDKIKMIKNPHVGKLYDIILTIILPFKLLNYLTIKLIVFLLGI